MINYYYEIPEGTTVFGHDLRYLSITDVKPDTVGWRHLHEEALKHSRRVWLENANGVSLVKTIHPYHNWEVIKPQELTWLKLICKDIESL
jgi:hypothetical protein